MAFNVGEYQEIFLEESAEQLQELNQNLLELEKDSGDKEIINNIFRAVHSLKGSAAFVGLTNLSELCHELENLLQAIRDDIMTVDPVIINLMFQCFDAISSIISSISAEEEPRVDLTPLLKKISALKVNEKMQKPSRGKTKDEDASRDNIPKTVLSKDEMKLIQKGLKDGFSCIEISIFIEPLAFMKLIKAQLVSSKLTAMGMVIKTIPDINTASEDTIGNIIKIILLSKNSMEQIKKECDIDLVYRIDMKILSVSKVDNKLALKVSNKQTFMEDNRGLDIESPKIKAPTQEIEYTDNTLDDSKVSFEQLPKDDFERKSGDKKSMILKTVRVSVDKLDLLLNNVGELVIANSGFYRLYEESRRERYDKAMINEFKSRIEQLSRIAKDLQSGIMKTRMVPIGQVFNRFNRLIRDLALEFNKKVQLIVKGQETELDKKVIDTIGEPLMHIIRNALDHGIETTRERTEMRKSEIATITLNAYQGGNQIFVEVSDDGRGLNIESIKRRAVERGLASPEIIENMDDDDICDFIFQPGFSTAEVITDVSGRGVGMDVVRSTVNELSGNINIETEKGMGTRFILSFPLTLAIIPAIMVKISHEMYAIPLTDVIETIKISESEIRTIEGYEVIYLRGEILSLLRLNEFINAESSLAKGKKIPIVIVGYGNRKIGLMVDTLEGKQEIVIKSLEQNYKAVEGFAGASILGDGSICLILDISSMINKVITEQDFFSKRVKKKFSDDTGEEDEKQVEKEEKIEVQGVEEKKTTIVVKENEEIIPKDKKDLKENIFIEKTTEKAIPSTRTPPEGMASVSKSVEKEPSSTKDAENIHVKKATGDFISEVKKSNDAGADDEIIKARVKETLDDFKKELRASVNTSVGEGDYNRHIKDSLGINDDDLRRIQALANSGIANAAEALSRILNKRIELAIPDVRVLPVENIPESIGEIDSVYIGVYMPLIGDIKGTILFSLKEDAGYDLISMLYKDGKGDINELDEDGESALKEVTNIIGSSVVNIFSEKIEMTLRPSVPTIVHDYMQSIIDSILVLYTFTNDYALTMDTELFYHGDRILGNLLVLPDMESLRQIIKKLKK